MLDAIQKAIQKKEGILVKTSSESYAKDSIDLIEQLLKDMHVVMVTFEPNIRDVVESLRYLRKADIKRLHIIDAISVFLHQGTPPVEQLISVSRPDSETDIYVYTYLFLEERAFKDVCVVMLGMHKLEEYQNWDEVGIFLKVFLQLLKRFNIPMILLAHDRLHFVFDQVISSQMKKRVIWG